MGKSYKKSPFKANTTSTSEKKCKTKANRTYRRVNKIIIHKFMQEPKECLLCLRTREVSNIWDMDKDGKYRFSIKENSSFLRK